MLFISLLKFFSLSKYLNFCLNFLVMLKNGLMRKTRLIPKRHKMSQPGKQTIAIQICPISQEVRPIRQ